MQIYEIFMENIYICNAKIYIYAYKRRKIGGIRQADRCA